MFFDAQIQVADTEFIAAGDHLEMVLFLATAIPTGQGLLPLPIGALRVPMSKQGAIDQFTKALEVANSLSEPEPESDIIVAKSLQGADKIADMDKKIKGKK